MIWAIVASVTWVGCAAPAATPTATPAAIVAQGQTNEDLLFTATVYDETDSLVTATVVPADSTGIDLSNPASEAVATVGNEEAALFVAWIGLPCEDRPALQVQSSDDRLEITLDRGPQREGETCPSYPHYFALRLEFDNSVGMSEIELNLAQ